MPLNAVNQLPSTPKTSRTTTKYKCLIQNKTKIHSGGCLWAASDWWAGLCKKTIFNLQTEKSNHHCSQARHRDRHRDREGEGEPVTPAPSLIQDNGNGGFRCDPLLLSPTPSQQRPSGTCHFSWQSRGKGAHSTSESVIGLISLTWMRSILTGSQSRRFISGYLCEHVLCEENKSGFCLAFYHATLYYWYYCLV